jgi:flavin-dependent dehydrogenase
MKSAHYDVAIIGGGPAGSTAGTLLKKYNPGLEVAIFEREIFPRDHIGESLLPPISPILEEMGCWDAIEAANFPIKIGASYRWGRSPERWDFEFIPAEEFKNESRPAKFEGQRRWTAFQVDRSIYDQILIDNAAQKGCEVRQGTKVAKVNCKGDTVTSLELGDGEVVTARYYIDASGNSGILRRALGVPCSYPTTLKNIAIYDYWQNAEWAVEIGVGGTRIQVLSLGYGWMWFIPLGPTRTSIGLVVPAEYYKKSGKTPAELYAGAMKEESIIANLTANATSEGNLSSTKDWSFLAGRHAGENWFLIGECSGFADPILSAGVSMAHMGGQQVAYTILEIDSGKTDPQWLKDQFGSNQKQRIQTHIRFADYWYTANSQFTNLKDFTKQLANDVGLDYSPEKAWDWMSRGGFIDEQLSIGTGGFSLATLRQSGEFLNEVAYDSPLEKNNILKLDLSGATWKESAVYIDGHVRKAPCYTRGDRVLPVRGVIEILVNLLQRESRMPQLMHILGDLIQQNAQDPRLSSLLSTVPEALEAMTRDGWIKASYDPRLPLGQLVSDGKGFRWNRDDKIKAAN